MVHRAYSVLQLKSVDDELRVIEGVATTPEPDRMGDVIVPEGAKFTLPIPLLWQHRSDQPIGHVTHATVSKKGITIRAQFAKIDEPGTLKDRLDEAWQAVKAKLVRGLSIGFKPLGEPERIKDTFAFKFQSWEWLELSAVTIAANADASISTIKSVDAPFLAASGTGVGTVARPSAGVPAPVKAQKKGPSAMKTVQEQISSFEATRQAKDAERTALMTKAAEAGETLDAEAAEKYDTLSVEIKSVDEHLVRLRALDVSNKSAAAEVKGANVEEGARSRVAASSPVIQVKDNLPPGIGFARSVKAMIVARLDGRNALDVAKEMYPSDDRLHKHLAHVQALPNIIARIKAAVPAASLASDAWAGALADPTNLPGEFVEFLRPATIIGRLNLRTVPTNVRLMEQTQGGTGYWVGIGAPKPLTAFGFAPILLNPTKVAAIAVATEESLRFSTPSLDQLIRDGLRDALVERVDRDLLDPAEAGTANVQPASLTSGLTALSSAGTSADNVRTDIARLVNALRTQNLRGPIALVMPDSLLTAISWMVNSLGQPEFPGLDGDGGVFKGIRFVGSEYVANASGAGNMVVAIAEREVFKSDDGGVRVDASREASLQMLDNPTNNSATATPTTSVSMWQTNSVAFRGEWFINWQKRRSSAVAYMDDVNWGSVGSPE